MTMTVQDVGRAYGNLEADICDADRLTMAIHELFLLRVTGVKTNVTDTEHNYLMETLLDRLRDLTGEIKRDFYKASKAVSAARNK